MGHGKTRLMKIKHESTSEGLVEALAEDLTPFSPHLFNAKWQSAQYKSVTSKCPCNTVVFCEDFAENYTCRPHHRVVTGTPSAPYTLWLPPTTALLKTALKSSRIQSSSK